MNNNDNLGTLINKKRKEKNLTQKDLAALLHISDKAISRWETNASLPDINMLQQIGAILEIPFDKLIQYKVEDKDEDTINTIVKEYEKKTKKIEKRYRKMLLIFFMALSFLILLTFFTSTYNQFKLYDIAIIGDDYFETIGLYVDTNQQDYIYLGALNLNKEVDEEKYSIDIFIENDNSEIILKHYDKVTNNIQFEVDKSYFKSNSLKRYFDNIYIRIVDSKNNQEVVGQLNFVLRFSNNKIFYRIGRETTDISKNIDFKDTFKKLEKLGFKDNNDNVYVDKSGNFKYYLNSNYMVYGYDDNKANLRYSYKYYFKNKKLFVTISSFKNDNEIIIEKYNYDVDSDKLDCKVGQCIDYKEILSFLDKYIQELS